MFQIRIMQESYDMKDPESKTAFYNEMAKKLLDFPEELERNNYIQAVAETYNIGFEELRRLVNSLRLWTLILPRLLRLPVQHCVFSTLMRKIRNGHFLLWQ